MSNSTTLLSANRFHEGEQALQSETGMQARIERAGQTMIRDRMPEQHQDFFTGLRYLFTATVDQAGQPWASVLSGPVGFVTTPDAQSMRIKTAQSLVGPAFDGLQIGTPIGVLGIDLSNRRRNRMHGRITHAEAHQLRIGVSQSFGNCPKYINTRCIDDERSPSTLGGTVLGDTVLGDTAERAHLNDEDLARIRRADTFFIASHHQDGSGAEYEGADISHRGGACGFVHVDGGDTLIIPDYSGNFIFNTLGNLLIEPRAGLLFIDFESGDLMQLSGEGTIIRDENAVAIYPGAERLLRVHVDKVRYTPGGLPLRWHFLEASPFNPAIINPT